MLKYKKILKELEEIYPDTLIADGLDEALIGITERKGHTIAVYEKAAVHQILTNDGLTDEEAIEYAEFNIYGAWIGEGTPMYVDTFAWHKHNPLPPVLPEEMYEL